MSGLRFRRCRVIGFIGLATTAILVGAAPLAQAQSNNASYWNNAGSAAWSNTANWTPGALAGGTYGFYYQGEGMVINNGGTATIADGDNVTDNSPGSTGYGWGGYVYVGGSDFLGGSGGNGYVNMSGGTLNVAGAAVHEILGVASGSGIFTQSGGVNVVYNPITTASGGDPGAYSSLELGYANGGYGEYRMNGGALGVNAIFVGGNESAYDAYNGAVTLMAGTGVFTQTGGSVGSIGTPGGANNTVGVMVGGNWSSYPGNSNLPGGPVFNASSVGTYTLGDPSGTGSPLLVGGCEVIGVSGTGTFTQTCGTNALLGGGNISGVGGGTPFNNATGACSSVGISGDKRAQSAI